MPIKDEPFEPIRQVRKPRTCANLRNVNLDGWNFDNLISMRDMFPSHPQLTYTQRQAFLDNGWEMSDGGPL